MKKVKGYNEESYRQTNKKLKNSINDLEDIKEELTKCVDRNGSNNSYDAKHNDCIDNLTKLVEAEIVLITKVNKSVIQYIESNEKTERGNVVLFELGGIKNG